MAKYVINVIFYHVHILISLDKNNQVADGAIEKMEFYAKNVYQESIMRYHEDNQYEDSNNQRDIPN